MTLVCSLRIPDGIVLAADSLSTMMQQLDLEGDVEVECPNCGEEHTLEEQPLGQANIPGSTFSYSQKVFPLFDRFGVGTFGAGQIAGRTIHFASRELERTLQEEDSTPEAVSEAADRLAEFYQDLLRKSVEGFEEAPEDWSPVGFQVVGYDEDQVPKTVELKIGRAIHRREFDQVGCTYSGQGHVVRALWGLYRQRPRDEAAFHAFSLQDAVDYADFLIDTTTEHMRFSQRIPQVGGDVDVCLVTPFDEFQWIRRKDLAKQLGW